MLLSPLLVAGVLALPSLAQMRRLHSGIARRMELEKKAESKLAKRSFLGRMTYYATGLGACGQYNSPGDFIVALNSAQYGGGYPGPNCFKTITISKGGKTVQATIVDECPTCGFGELDMSEGLFTQFASTDAGIFDAEWWFNDGSGGSQDPPPQNPPPQNPPPENPPPQNPPPQNPPPQNPPPENPPPQNPPQNPPPENPPQNPENPPQNPETPPQNPETPPQNPETPPQNPETPPQNPETPPQNTDTPPPENTDTAPPQTTDTVTEHTDATPTLSIETAKLQETEATPTTSAASEPENTGHCKRLNRRVPVNF